MPHEIREATNRLTAGDVSRALRVDLKTVHNWVARGLLHGARTRGGHLRFLPTEVIRFLRHRRRPVPPEVAVGSPRVVAVGIASDLVARLGAQVQHSVYDALLGLDGTSCDVVVLALDGLEVDAVRDLASALARQPASYGMATIGVAFDVERRRAFLAGGGDVALPSEDGLERAIAYVSGRPGLDEPELESGPRTTRDSGTFPALVPVAVAAGE